MAGRYVPPHLRNKTNSNAADGPPASKPEKPQFDSDEHLVTPEEVKNHFWPINEDSGAFATTSNSRTLHDSAARPGQLSYLFLFRGANPSWESDGIVYTKSSLELLPPAGVDDNPQEAVAAASTTTAAPAPATDPTDGVAPDEAAPAAAIEDTAHSKPVHNGDAKLPIAVFKQVRPQQAGRSFAFEGWYRIHRLTYLEPQSQELIRMLEKKWTRTDRYGRVQHRQRDEASWQQSLSLKWAVVKFEKHVEAEAEGPPMIQRLAEDFGVEERERRESRKKSVNEMLEELRTGGAGEVKPATAAVEGSAVAD